MSSYGIINQIFFSKPLIFLKSFGITSSSNGRYPANKAYTITPQLQVSTSVPLYFLLCIVIMNFKNKSFTLRKQPLVPHNWEIHMKFSKIYHLSLSLKAQNLRF